MRISVDVRAGGAASAAAELRLRLALARFAPSVVTVAVRAAPRGPGRAQLRGRALLVGGAVVALTTEDEASEAATLHFIDRFARAVARRGLRRGGPRA